MRASFGGRGIQNIGQATKITNSWVVHNTNEGILNSGSKGAFSGDRELSNGLTTGSDGLYLSGMYTVVTSNIANGNGGNGIFVGGTRNTLTKNIADFNAHDGIYVDSGIFFDTGGNSAKGNHYATGATPEQCLDIACS